MGFVDYSVKNIRLEDNRPSSRQSEIPHYRRPTYLQLGFILRDNARFLAKTDAHFLAKKELFRWPFGPVIKWLGGIAIDRSSTANSVDRMITTFKKNKIFVLALAPEGTRYKVRYWKSGFYHIAVGAGVPIQIGFIDYASKTGGAGPLIHPSGDITGDMEIIHDFYMKIKGKHSEQTAPASIYTKS